MVRLARRCELRCSTVLVEASSSDSSLSSERLLTPIWYTRLVPGPSEEKYFYVVEKYFIVSKEYFDTVR